MIGALLLSLTMITVPPAITPPWCTLGSPCDMKPTDCREPDMPEYNSQL